ncbi:ABC transporter G family member 24-like [Zingiber officinale]|uniref:ABC transporter G family member 24-like n=1 Tax=Zingiber officinale TaxID=94328 RepID=UPI001C4B2269|nr:ABC transporter G family member 24-like [Zingiber officinale]
MMRARPASATARFLVAVAALLLLFPLGRCQSFGGVNPPPSLTSPLLSQLNEDVNNVTRSLFPLINDRFGFCIKDAQSDWDRAFNYSTDMSFMVACAATTPDIDGRLCTAAEVTFYFNSFIDSGGRTNYMKPNKNCNSSSWVPGCEPGWASSVPPDEKVDLQESQQLPSRNVDSKPCCPGFYCPYGITCMIPCPLGAYCPLATFNVTTGLCDPYQYQLPSGETDHSCGGADIWADVDHSSDLFCPAGIDV